jgi:hypothetical protein
MTSLSSFDATQSAMPRETSNCSSESETEDEEITMTCTGGIPGANFETDESDESQTDLSTAEVVDEE